MTNTTIIIIIAIQYAISFFGFGWIVRGWREEDIKNKREWFRVLKFWIKGLSKRKKA